MNGNYLFIGKEKPTNQSKSRPTNIIISIIMRRKFSVSTYFSRLTISQLESDNRRVNTLRRIGILLKINSLTAGVFLLQVLTKICIAGFWFLLVRFFYVIRSEQSYRSLDKVSQNINSIGGCQINVHKIFKWNCDIFISYL